LKAVQVDDFATSRNVLGNCFPMHQGWPGAQFTKRSTSTPPWRRVQIPEDLVRSRAGGRLVRHHAARSTRAAAIEASGAEIGKQYEEF